MNNEISLIKSVNVIGVEIINNNNNSSSSSSSRRITRQDIQENRKYQVYVEKENILLSTY